MPAPVEDKSTEDLVTAAMAALPADEVDEPVVPEPEPDEAEKPAEGEKPADGEKPKEGEKPKADDDDDPELTKLLEEYGIKRAGGVQQDSRMPYSRVRKVTGKIVKTLHEKHVAALAEREAKITAAEKELKPFRDMDTLIKTDPDRYMGILSVLHPEKYKKYLTPAEVKAEVKEVKAAAAVPIPGPDIKYDDGTVGFSPEQMDKRDEWLVNKAKSDALTEMTTRFKPLEDRFRADETNAELRPKVMAQVERMVGIWGEDFRAEFNKGSESEIIKLLKVTPGLTFDAACAQVLLPRRTKALTADREKMRTELIAEMNKRPAGAARTTPAQSRETRPTNVDRTTEDIVGEVLASLR